MKPNKIIGHNYNNFDGDFLLKKSNKYNIKIKLEAEIIDTLNLSRKLSKEGKINIENHKQKTLATYFNINYEAHSAIEDVKALIKIYNKLVELQSGSTHIKVERQNLGF
jgi:DNA polymerase III epsilon subunit-like protein